jgi:uncharacterized protein (DUF1778 family)
MTTSTAEVNIHLRARAEDRALIDQAAELAGMNRSYFMLSSALKEAHNVLIDRNHIQVDRAAFHKMLAWMDSEQTSLEREGLKRLLDRKADWVRD